MSTFAPYPFQRHVAALLLSGQSVILQAPTGAGKTFAALLPFFEARQQGLDFPRKCIYAVPMRVLANQFAAEEPPLPLRVAIQTGEHRDDPGGERRHAARVPDTPSGYKFVLAGCPPGAY